MEWIYLIREKFADSSDQILTQAPDANFAKTDTPSCASFASELRQKGNALD